MSRVYPKYLQAALSQSPSVDLDGATLRAVFVKVVGGYTYSDAHQYLSDIAAGDRLATSEALTGISLTDGVFSAGSTNFVTPTNASDADAVAVYKDTGAAATSPLIEILDEDSFAGFPLPLVGVDIPVTWPPYLFAFVQV